VGSIGTTLQLSLLALLAGPLRLHYLAATALAVEAALCHNFLWHERWTWRDRARVGERLGRFLRFHGTTGLVSILGNLAFMKLFVGIVHMHPVAGNLASIGCCAALNFVLNDRVVFAD
jgi:dolichol-phosphate mannosyltransferase